MRTSVKEEEEMGAEDDDFKRSQRNVGKDDHINKDDNQLPSSVSSMGRMELRKSRKATIKKRLLMEAELASSKRLRQEESANTAICGEDSDHSSVTTSESASSMTLEQFSEIVLASEGLCVDQGAEANNNHLVAKKEDVGSVVKEARLVPEERLVSEEALAASLMRRNSDLIVEVRAKPSQSVEGKPVVLLPRQPHWRADMYGGNNFEHATAGPAIGAATVVAVRPRMAEASANTSAEASAEVAAANRLSPVKEAALNLSLKNNKSELFAAPLIRPKARLESKVSLATTLEKKVEGDMGRAVRDLRSALVKDAHGNFPLHMAVLVRKPSLVRRLCCALHLLDASVDVINDDKMTPLHLAVREGSLSSLEVLLAFGADPGLRDGCRGNSGLHIAAARRDAAAIRCLVKHLRHKNDINALNANGITPLHITTAQSDTASAEVLIEHGADPTVPDAIHGLSPLDMAKQERLPARSTSPLPLSKRPLSLPTTSHLVLNH